MTEALRLTNEQFKDMVAVEAKNALSGELPAMIEDVFDRKFHEWERSSQAQRRKMETDAKKAIKSMIFGAGGRPAPEGLKDVMPTINGREAFTGESFAELAIELTAGGFSPDLRTRAADKLKTDPNDSISKALEASTFASGGALVPQEYSADFIAYLYDRTVVRALGARTIDMGQGNLVLGRQDATATAYWRGEGERIVVSQQSFGQLVLNAKELGVLVPISEQLLQRRPAGLETIVRDDMASVAALAEDAALLRGDGTQGRIKGIKSAMASGNKFAAQASTDLAKTTVDLLKAMYKVDSANIPMIQTGWAFNPRILYYLMALRSTDGYPVYMMELAQGTLYGSRFRTTNGIPRNLSNDGDETEIYFGDFSQIIIGETLNMNIAQSNQASFVDAGGNTVHGFQDGIHLIRLTHSVDMALRHSRAFALIEGVDWGATFDA